MGGYIFVIRRDDATYENYQDMKEAIKNLVEEKKAYIDMKQYVEE